MYLIQKRLHQDLAFSFSFLLAMVLFEQFAEKIVERINLIFNEFLPYPQLLLFLVFCFYVSKGLGALILLARRGSIV